MMFVYLLFIYLLANIDLPTCSVHIFTSNLSCFSEMFELN